MYTVYVTNSIDQRAITEPACIEQRLEFANMEDARAFMTTTMRLDPHFQPRCIRCLEYAENLVAVDFGSWSRFIFLQGDGALNW